MLLYLNSFSDSSMHENEEPNSRPKEISFDFQVQSNYGSTEAEALNR